MKSHLSENLLRVPEVSTKRKSISYGSVKRSISKNSSFRRLKRFGAAATALAAGAGGGSRHHPLHSQPLTLATCVGLAVKPILPIKPVKKSIPVYIELVWYTQGCICGRLSLRSGVFAVALIELFFAAVSLITAADYLIKDGHFFYSDAFVGYGKQLFGYSLIMNGLCIATVVALLAGVRTRQHKLLLPHVVWQATYLAAQLLAAAAVLFLWNRNQIFPESAVVLLCEKAVCVLVELYFITVTYNCAEAIRMRRQVHKAVAADGCRWAAEGPSNALVQSRRHLVAFGQRDWGKCDRPHSENDSDTRDCVERPLRRHRPVTVSSSVL